MVVKFIKFVKFVKLQVADAYNQNSNPTPLY
jgi:hypothetical protein